MRHTLTLGRIHGIAVSIHYTWLIAFAMVAWSLAMAFRFSVRRTDPGAFWWMGLAGALLLFVSVLLHELSHSFVAQALGHRVRGITLFIFGGVSMIEGESRKPRDEFLVAFVGPLCSFVLAGVFWLVARAIPPIYRPLVVVADYLALANLMLAVFNLLPGFPLDGGRVLRSIIWRVSGSLRRATRIASYVGQGLAFVLMGLGVARLVLANDVVGGVWTVFIGWFLNSAAAATRREEQDEGPAGLRVRDVMGPRPALVPAQQPVAQFVADVVLGGGARVALVVDSAGQVLGIATVGDLARVPQATWATTPIAAIMTAGPLKVVQPDADLRVVLRAMVDHGVNQVPVIENGAVVGLLRRADLLRVVGAAPAEDERAAASFGPFRF